MCMNIKIYIDPLLVARIFVDSDKNEDLLSDDICDIMKVVRHELVFGVFYTYQSSNGAIHSLALQILSLNV